MQGYLKKKRMWAGAVAQWLEHLQLFLWTGVQFPVYKSGSSELPANSVPGNLIASSGLCGHIHTCTYIN